MRSVTFRIIAGALGIRVLSAIIAFMINAVFPMAQREQFTIYPRTHLFWDTFARWDSGSYFDIARYGYKFVEDGRSNLAFFPLYPMLMRYLALAMGGGRVRVYMAGIIISWTAFVLAMIVLYRLAKLDVPEGASRALVYAAVFPFAFFFGVVYPESLFLLFTVTAFYGFRTRQWWLGAAAGALATATRANGIFMLPALALVAFRETRGNRSAMVRAGAALGATLLGIGVYSLFIYSISGDPLEWAKSMRRWNWSPGAVPGWQPLVTLMTTMATSPYAFITASPHGVIDLLNATAAIAVLAVTPFIWRRFGPAYPMLILINLYIPLSSGLVEGMGRYAAVLFPVALWLATLRTRLVRDGILVAFAMLYVLCLALFTKVYPLY
ncbi:MAG: mannosyltransferase family protein [Vicinamibacterales bacterium]